MSNLFPLGSHKLFCFYLIFYFIKLEHVSESIVFSVFLTVHVGKRHVNHKSVDLTNLLKINPIYVYFKLTSTIQMRYLLPQCQPIRCQISGWCRPITAAVSNGCGDAILEDVTATWWSVHLTMCVQCCEGVVVCRAIFAFVNQSLICLLSIHSTCLALSAC